MTSSAVNDSVRSGLETERDDLVRRLDELTIDGSAAQDFDENFADSAQVAAELGENLTLAAALREQLADVEGALARLENGTYGRCQECGDVIGADRLEAMPATPFCITHA
ncbi:MAG: TraR/DksA C4-type zinc finger protein [Acidimicrobiales bacterium]|jgi:DnaK suppressor protein|nr:TraR/DksA C4-type zinc finger protein [Acidimicrobiales bacterium]HMS90187.1 TraR/DksA C4-type zinc finger protein [Acidimicrobiales bacterium]